MIGPAADDDRDRVGPYRLLKAIGAGGSARVDLARLDRVYGFQRHVVIKRPLEHLREDPRAAASLHREARIGGLLRHPNLVAVLDAGRHDGYDYLALEYVHGASLRALMQAEAGPKVRDAPPAVALAIVADVARALHHAHELTDEDGAPLGLVHRDVSPGNVLVALDGAVKLSDFGIAKETRVATLSGSMHGTVTYMAPEQCRGHAFDRRADVFSLGVICYELVTGARLFWADNDVASLHRVLSGNVPRPRKVRPSVPPALEELVMTAVAPEPERRFPTAQAFASAIEAYAAQAGLSLAARWIARWAADVLGPREAPWSAIPAAPASVAEGTARRAAPDGEGSLVELIAAVPDEAPPDATFGPSDERASQAAPDQSGSGAAGPRTEARRGRRRRMAIGAIIAGGLAAGGLGSIKMMDREVAPAAGSISAPVAAPPPAPTPAPAPPVVPAPEVPVEAVAAPAAPGPDPSPKRPAPAVPKKKPRGPAAAAAPDRAEIAAGSAAAPEPKLAPSAPPVAAEAGAGSQAPAVKPRSSVKWSPTLMLPSDSGSGSGTKR